MNDSHAATPDTPARFPRYAVGLLFVIYTLSFVDRQIVNILAEPIKTDLGLSDTQLGMLTGLAFALLYTSLGIPLARIAERSNRSRLISASLLIWSLFTAACGLAHAFWQLLVFRIAVGVGEAGCSPSAQTLIADLTHKASRARALAIYSMGVPVGSMLGMVIGGFVLQNAGWRSAFLVVGLPGIAVALLTLLTLRDPRRGGEADRTDTPIPPLRAALGELVRRRSVIWLALGGSMTSFVAYGQQAFLVSFFLRNHEAQIALLAADVGLGPLSFLGTVLGLILGIGGALGTLLGGTLSDRNAPRDPGAYAIIPGWAALFAAPLFAVAFLVPSASLSLLFLIVPSLLSYVWLGPVFAGLQSVVHPRSRATAVAVFLFVNSAIGLGLGPLSVGMFSDLFTPAMGGGEALRWALVAASPGALVSAYCFWRARRHLRIDVPTA